MHKHKANVTKLHKSRIKKTVSADINIDDEGQEMVQEEAFSLPSTIMKVKSVDDNSGESLAVSSNILKCDITEDINKVLNNYTQLTNNTIDKLVDDTNVNIYFAEEVLSACTATFDQTIQENMIISKDMLQLRDVSDMLNFQRKVVSENFNNFADLFLNISNISQSLINKKMENSTSFVDKHIKCFI
jgi:hypothetical protein